MSRVAITGATGFLGAALTQRLQARGDEVIALARRPPSQEGVRFVRCELPDLVPTEALEGADTLVHCAFETRFVDAARARAVNVDGSARLFDAARAAGVGAVVFISSLSAHDEAVSVYGRTKLEVEGLLGAGDTALRPGFIIGPGGVFWRTARSIARLPFIPLFFGGRQRIQTLHVGDACAAIEAAIDRRIGGVLKVAEPTAVPLRDFYAAIARALGRRPRFARLPGGLTLRALTAAERLGVQLPLSSDNLRGLARLRTFDVTDDLQRLGVEPISMHRALQRIPWNELRRP